MCEYHSVNAISISRHGEGLSVFMSFDLNSKKDAPAFAMHSESFVAQAARKGRMEVSTKHLNSEEL